MFNSKSPQRYFWKLFVSSVILVLASAFWTEGVLYTDEQPFEIRVGLPVAFIKLNEVDSIDHFMRLPAHVEYRSAINTAEFSLPLFVVNIVLVQSLLCLTGLSPITPTQP